MAPPKLFRVILLLLLSDVIVSRSIVKTLPGYSNDLPFQLETGYVGVGEKDDVQLFYYFVESERSPKDDPLILWLAGGPGCSALRAFFYEIDLYIEGEEEDEVIVFKPSLNEKHADRIASNLTFEFRASGVNTSKVDLGNEGGTFSSSRDGLGTVMPGYKL
ncbi:unnamed protein product [Ilex paraguariensis]|uniref:Uncharacterized protein n=1 Tax=Ilex paraguariensis TaxID=185542 RepID=A0ABC8SCJ6_9AQUA